MKRSIPRAQTTKRWNVLLLAPTTSLLSSIQPSSVTFSTVVVVGSLLLFCCCCCCCWSAILYPIQTQFYCRLSCRCDDHLFIPQNSQDTRSVDPPTTTTVTFIWACGDDVVAVIVITAQQNNSTHRYGWCGRCGNGKRPGERKCTRGQTPKSLHIPRFLSRVPNKQQAEKVTTAEIRVNRHTCTACLPACHSDAPSLRRRPFRINLYLCTIKAPPTKAHATLLNFRNHFADNNRYKYCNLITLHNWTPTEVND